MTIRRMEEGDLSGELGGDVLEDWTLAAIGRVDDQGQSTEGRQAGVK